MRLNNQWVGEAGYRELLLTNRQYAFLREYGDKRLVAIVNNDDNNADIHLNINGEFTEIFQEKKEFRREYACEYPRKFRTGMDRVKPILFL